MPATEAPLSEARADARRNMEICNACRYCEGFCAVFPAMQLRRDFSAGDLGYLANLCHGCQGCFYACQYAPPHPWGINVPQAFALVRAETYAEHAWPRPLARLFERNGTVVALLSALAVTLVLLLAGLLQREDVLLAAHTGPGAFYAAIPYGAMVWTASAAFLYALLALAMATASFWHASGGRPPGPLAVARALHDAMTLRNLGGGGDGCNYPGESFSFQRRWLHHAMAYGFLLCFAATTTGTIYHHGLGLVAPYAWLSLPVVLGTLGGVLVLSGTTGLLWLKVLADPAPAARAVLGGDYAFLILLNGVAKTGLLLLVFRATAAMGWLLALHLGFVLALFLLLPYSKFVHGLFRTAALVRSQAEAPR
jgi:citrate/tricarballylate utilization protein